MKTLDLPFPDPGLSTLIGEFTADWQTIQRRYKLSLSPTQLTRQETLLGAWEERLAALPFADLPQDAKIDAALLKNHFKEARADIRRRRMEGERLEGALPFAAAICTLEAAKADFQPLDPREAAKTLDQLALSIKEAPDPTEDAVALAWVEELEASVSRWSDFYSGYDPEIDWWIREPLARVKSGLAAFIEKQKDAEKNSESIPGRPIGREALIEDIRLAMAASSPEELIAVGEAEYAWCMEQMLKASRELGFGSDWKAALEHVKETCLPPGEQPAMVLGLAREAEEYVKDLVTVPDLAREVWRMEMMAAERQKVSPFFLGGEAIIVSYPTDTMNREEKQMSMRGNNPNFSRATVQHELIPGHHLQFFMLQRHRPYRSLFGTCFWVEGWTIYWEFLLWELGFPRTPEERIGMLFWRMHRCVRVVFSLRYHLGELTTQECVDMLVDRVGHERLNAEGEVRRSFNGTYPPLYQAAYLLGGKMFWAISKELQSKGWSLKQIHDGMLQQNQMPPAMMRLALLGEAPPEHEAPMWRFPA